MNIYVGNLPYTISESELSGVFSKYSDIASVRIIKDKFSGRSKGFAFVEMEDNSAAQKAISELNGIDLKGRNIIVNEARPAKQ